MSGGIHYEVFARKTPASGWALQGAVENREAAIAMAEDMLAQNRAAAVMVTKEVFSESSGEFKSFTVLNKGAPEQKKKDRPTQPAENICGSPQELYTAQGREKVARLLEDWLRRYKVTAFEMMHRPDLVERFEASNNDVQHAAQKLAVPEAQETGASIHEIMRRWTALIDKACTRVISDGRKNLFPDLTLDGLTAQIDKINSHPEKAYVLGGGVAKLMKAATTPAGKLEVLLPFVHRLAESREGWGWAVQVFEAPIMEIFAGKTALTDIVGQELDLGSGLAILTRLVAGPEAKMVAKIDPVVSRTLPELTGVLADILKLIEAGHFKALSASISKRLLVELKSVRRLRPSSPVLEIETLRALALVMTAAGKEQTQREDIAEAFAERSKTLVSSDFVESLTKDTVSAFGEIERLIWLCENVVGSANKRQAVRWVSGCLTGHRFEREIRDASKSAPTRLSFLAGLQKRLIRAELPEKEAQELRDKLGALGASIASEVNLMMHLTRVGGSSMQKLTLLLGFAAGQSAPLGPVSDMAKAEVMKLLKSPEARTNLMSDPAAFMQLRPLMQAAGIGAAA
ncbi:hypothetical protein OVA03_12670 [Asticcacaulis sp. SL142]|uniref:hypothetical protein n=1 Tax=Asticcacaulis sp. SL142 TaxID=2995155 RepID=UPI00226D195A|nr:hypothetical protein [Asticcacaulis sp. SL142]WAC47550.1 hypothetical protein OVA03_12670 [Asticcacaulis sp. SL142]